MAIVQISKIQQRSGNLVDLPQLDEAEFGWAVNDRRLFIGRGADYDPENIEVLTSYSNISFSQVVGSDGGNFNITSATNGQLLTYVASTNTWENYTGDSSQLDGGKIQLGNVANIQMDGGAIGYVLETDGLGNLSWTPKGALYSNITDLSPDASNSFGIIANIVVMQVDANTPYVNGAVVTITGVEGVSNTSVNSQEFYIKLADDFPTSGNTTLYTDPALDAGNALVLGSLTYTNAPNGIATSIIATGGSSAGAAGSNTSVLYNGYSVVAGDAYFTWDFANRALSVVGTANITSNLTVGGNVDVTGKITSYVSTGTAPLTVTSTTRVANLNVATSGVANTVNDAAQPNVTSVGTLTSLNSSGNITAPIVIANANGTGNNFKVGDDAWIGDINITNTMVIKGQQDGANGYVIFGNSDTTSTLGRAGTGPLTYNGAFTSNGNLIAANINTAGTVTASRLISNVATGTAPFTVTSTTQVANLNAATAGLATYATTANAVAGANVSGAVAYATTANSVAGANVSGAVAYATTANSVAGANVSGQVGNALVAGTVYTAAQPNITSVSTSFTNLTFANAQTITGNNMTLTTGANTNAGTITGNWSLSSGSKLQATYADLAEYYEADAYYEPGTVLEFGGEKEVTIAEDGTTRVAGVVSTNPAYAMNAECKGIAVAIALQGRVPCKVRGKVRKGDIMVSAGNGYARPWQNAQIGMVIGKAIENFEGVEGVIEIAVGRL